MSAVPEIDAVDARKLLDDGSAVFLDIRDPGSYASGHIAGAENIGNHNIMDFVQSADRSAKVVVYCYKGFSSQQATQWLQAQGAAATSAEVALAMQRLQKQAADREVDWERFLTERQQTEARLADRLRCCGLQV